MAAHHAPDRWRCVQNTRMHLTGQQHSGRHTPLRPQSQRGVALHHRVGGIRCRSDNQALCVHIAREVVQVCP
ncbi:Uncharacterised protein [Escherichia coli]|uniref:Uncharacterized protein n=1 Tax=Escherichia coli TaxID=562 RepID=A0A376U5X0_ECOLX|nr:Uncharacterised protein [Escherichia coli]